MIEDGASDNTIGGLTSSPGTGAGNVIAGNGSQEIYFYDTTGNVIAGNLIGTDITGKVALSNSDGVFLDIHTTNNTIGGTAVGAGNLISGGFEGILVGETDSGNLIAGNQIGTDITGTVAVPNTYGVVLDPSASSNTIGGTSAGAGNTIAFNTTAAVDVAGTGDAILENLIFRNGSGIVLTSGGNDDQSAPAITGVTSDATAATSSQTAISVDLTAAGFTAGSTYSLDFFASGLGDPTSGVQAHIYLGTQTFAGDTTGDVTFTLPIPLLSATETVTATATLLSGSTFTDTSAFATAAAVSETSNFIVTTTAATGAGSLEQAILDANADTTLPTPYTITFAVTPGSAPFTINLPSSGLTSIARSVALDATSQAGYAGSPIIVLNGTGVSGSGLVLGTGSDGSLLRGFDIIDFTAAGTDGIDIESGGNAVQASYVGVQTNGSTAAANTVGILITGANNTIGGTAAGAGNLISGNTTYGVQITGSGATGNTVEGNQIGTDVTGTVAIANATGVELNTGASGNTIGGPTATPGTGAGNLISGNTVAGITISDTGTSGNAVEGNLIGTKAGGTSPLANGSYGVVVQTNAATNTIGGTAAGASNVISGNAVTGVYIANTSATNYVQGNYIGTDVTGTAAVPNLGGTAGGPAGVFIGFANNQVIGGTTAAARNVISGNTNEGLVTDALTSITLEGNYIGTNAAGTGPLGNSENGIVTEGGTTGITIGGTAAGAGNVVSGNGDVGIAVESGITVVGNDIGLNAAGTSAIGNYVGILVAYGASNDTIGGTAHGAGNVISGNTTGVSIGGGGGVQVVTGNLVIGNEIGTNAAGTAAIGNGTGVVIQVAAGGGTTSSNTIGGSVAGAGNLISGNTTYGVQITGSGATGNVIEGNLIGTDLTGTVAIANATGVELDTGASGNTIGGLTATPGTGLGNVISGSILYDVNLQSGSNLLLGNLIGTAASGENTLSGVSSNGAGVYSTGVANTIGGMAAGAEHHLGEQERRRGDRRHRQRRDR